MILILETFQLLENAIDEIQGTNARYGRMDPASAAMVPDFFVELIASSGRNPSGFPSCPWDIKQTRLRLMLELDGR